MSDTISRKEVPCFVCVEGVLSFKERPYRRWECAGCDEEFSEEAFDAFERMRGEVDYYEDKAKTAEREELKIYRQLERVRKTIRRIKKSLGKE